MYNLVRGDIELQAELERPQPFKCGSFGASSLAERHLATGDFGGNLATWDLERLNTPVYAAKAHDTIINCLDGCGGVKGAGAPEIATGSRDGRVHVWDVRQPDVPVASMEPEAGGAPRGRRDRAERSATTRYESADPRAQRRCAIVGPSRSATRTRHHRASSPPGKLT